MASKRSLATKLGVVAGFEDPRLALEQYPTPPDLAAHVVHLADLHDDVDGRTVLDLGTGTGMLALAAALRGPARVLGVELDRAALTTATANERRVAASASSKVVQVEGAVLLAASPMMISGLVVGLVVSIFQAATQINEQTLSFLPRLLATLVTIMALGPWLLSQMVDSFHRLMTMMPGMVG